MISTPIGITLQSQIPTLYPQSDGSEKTEAVLGTVKTDPIIIPQQETTTNVSFPTKIETKLLQNDTNTLIIEPLSHKTSSPGENLLLDVSQGIKDVDQSELYAEYLTNPYNDTKNLSTEVAVLYDPLKDQTVPETGSENETLLVQKSLSENTTPMHRNKAQFSSTDNVRQESSIFNYSSYFSAAIPGSDEFDTLMSTQEG